MDEVIFLLDTCSYLRLAKSIRPLLNVAFEDKSKNKAFRLLIHKDLVHEIERSQRLQGKFPWVNDKEFADDKKAVLHLTAQEQNSISKQETVVHEIALDESIHTSPIDERCLTTAFCKGIYLISDDKGIHELAKIFDFEEKLWTTLHILRRLFDTENGPDADAIQRIINYWHYINDIPANFDSDLKKYFGKILK